MAIAVNFVGQYTQSEATAAQRTFCFPAVDATDGITEEAGLTYAGADCLISKNGAAFGNLAGTVTEIGSTGVYQVVLAAGDLDTLGTAIIKFIDAAARDVWVTLQVIAMDLNVATIAVGTGGITAASFAAGAIDAAAIAADAIGSSEAAATLATEIQSGLATSAQVTAITSGAPVRNRFVNLGNLDDDESTVGAGIEDMATGVVTCTGTWDSSTVTVQTCANPAATSPVWTTYGTPLTANGTVALTGPLKAVRATMSSAGAGSTVDVTLAVRKY